mmetsp:Transcript_10297/g.15732  ORF Transcript_10297/g.15732 Transcript_10297/m.15732 type:complete len:538 (+) Transcript_10297:515-2128(+)
MAVKRVLKLLRQGLHLQALRQKLLLQVVDLLSQVGDLGGLRLDDSQLALVVTDLELEKADILETLLILDFTTGEGALEDLDLLVEEGELIVSTDELGAQDVSLVDDVLVVLLELLDLFVGLLDDVGEFGDLVVLLLPQLLRLVVLVLPVLELALDLLNQLALLGLVVVLLVQGVVGCLDLVLQLRNLMGGDLELPLQLSDLVLGLDQVLRVQVTIGTDSLVEVLLLLQLAFELDVLLLELTDQVLLELDLFDHLHQVGVGLAGLVGESISVLLKGVDLAKEVGDVLLLSTTLLFELGDLVVLLGDLVLVLVVLVLGLLDGLAHHVSEADQVDDLLLVLLGVAAKVLDLTGQGVHSVLRDVLLVLSLSLLAGDAVLVVLQAVVLALQVLVLLLDLADASAHVVDLFLELLLLLAEGELFALDLVVGTLEHVEVLVEVLEVAALLGELAVELRELVIQKFGLRLQLLLVLLELLVDTFLLVDGLLVVLLLRLVQLGVSLVLDLLFDQLLDLVLLLLDFFLLLQQLVLELHDLLVERGLR